MLSRVCRGDLHSGCVRQLTRTETPQRWSGIDLQNAFQVNTRGFCVISSRIGVRQELTRHWLVIYCVPTRATLSERDRTRQETLKLANYFTT